MRSILAAATALSLAPAAMPVTAVAANKGQLVCAGLQKAGGVQSRLRQVDIYDGPRADNAILAPDTSDEAGGKLVNRWSFSADQKVTVVCAYGPKGPDQARQLSKLAGCVVTFRPAGGANWRPESVVCG
jgi:hypothetical protein